MIISLATKVTVISSLVLLLRLIIITTIQFLTYLLVNKTAKYIQKAQA
jgi:hypothetical protein